MSHSHRDMTHSHVRHDSFARESRPISTYRHDSFTRETCLIHTETWLIHTWDMPHSHANPAKLAPVAMTYSHRDMTHSHLWHDSFICETWLMHTETWLIHMWDMTHSHDETWLNHTWDMTHSHRDMTLSHRHDSVTRETWLIWGGYD